MKTRVLAAVLWSITGWCIGSMVGWMLDLGTMLAPILSVAAAILIAADPRHVLSARQTPQPKLQPDPTAA